MSASKTWRYVVELGSSPDTNPLFLTLRDGRVEWQPRRAWATGFSYHHEAWDFILANDLPASRISCR